MRLIVLTSCSRGRRYRTQLCNDGERCNRPVCFFAHTLVELRVPAVKPFVPPEALAAASMEASRISQPQVSPLSCLFVPCLLHPVLVHSYHAALPTRACFAPPWTALWSWCFRHVCPIGPSSVVSHSLASQLHSHMRNGAIKASHAACDKHILG